METGELRIAGCGALFAVASLLAGCVSNPPTRYFWGSYEELIYASYAKPGAVTSEMQIAQLEKDYQVARSKNKRMPPGWHAHVGHLYYELGKSDEASKEFRTEKVEYPESAVLMDRFIARTQPAPPAASPTAAEPSADSGAR